MAAGNIKARNLKQIFDLEDHKQYEVANHGARVYLFAPDPTITATDTKVLAAAAAGQVGDTWPELTPVYYDVVDSAMKIWEVGQAIEGFIITGYSGTTAGAQNRFGELQLDATACVQGLVLTKGAVYAPDVTLPPGQNQTDLDDALRSGLREDNIEVLGLEGVR